MGLSDERVWLAFHADLLAGTLPEGLFERMFSGPLLKRRRR